MGSGVGDPEPALLPFTSFSVSLTWGSQEPRLPRKPLLCTRNELTISWSLLGWVLGLWGQPGWGPDPTLLLSQSVPKAVAWRAEAQSPSAQPAASASPSCRFGRILQERRVLTEPLGV